MPIKVRIWLAAGLLALGTSLQANAEDLSSYTGQQLFAKLCASCHGPTGSGDGRVAALFKISPPDLTRIAARHGGVFDAAQIRRFVDGTGAQAAHGTREMPVWGVELQAASAGPDGANNQPGKLIDLLVDYLRTLQRK